MTGIPLPPLLRVHHAVPLALPLLLFCPVRYQAASSPHYARGTRDFRSGRSQPSPLFVLGFRRGEQGRFRQLLAAFPAAIVSATGQKAPGKLSQAKARHLKKPDGRLRNRH